MKSLGLIDIFFYLRRSLVKQVFKLQIIERMLINFDTLHIDSILHPGMLASLGVLFFKPL
jgi:hypothetical protein